MAIASPYSLVSVAGLDKSGEVREGRRVLGWPEGG